MLIPIEIIEYDIKASGFEHKIPKNEHSFIGGRDDRIEDAPLGYYRFHYWVNSDTSKPHDNYVFIGKFIGSVCISLIQEKDERFRILIRSTMVWKSLIIYARELSTSSNISLRTLVLKEAIKRFCDCIFPEVVPQILGSGLSSPLNMVSIDINSNEDDSKTKIFQSISRNSSLNSIRSSFTLSGLGESESFAGSQESVSFFRFGSMASLSKLSTSSSDDSRIDDDQKQGILEDLSIKFFKKAYKIKEKNFPSNLLELENPLTPKAFNFDVIDLSEKDGESFKKFQQVLGQEINRKETVNYVSILAGKYNLDDTIPSMISSTKNASFNMKSPNSSKLDSIIDEFIETEKNYIQNLTLIDKLFISYLKNDDVGKFILKIKDFKNLFAGIAEFIPIHQNFLSNLLQVDSIDNFISALDKLSSSKSLYSYQSYFTTYEKRMESFKSCLENYPKFAQYHDDCVNNIEDLNRKGLDQLFIAPIQRIPRYNLLLKEMLKYVNDTTIYENLKSTSEEIGKVAQFLNTAKHKADQIENLFNMQRKVNNLHPDFLKPDRSFLTKIACYMIDPVEGKVSKTRLTIFLCNDIIIFAKKRSSVYGTITHDFLFSANINHIQFHVSRSKNGEKIYFTAEIEHSSKTYNDSDLKSIFFGRELGAEIRGSFRFSPKNHKRLPGFISEFSDARNQFLLSESPAKLMFKQEEKWDIFFHIFDSKDQIKSINKSQVLIVHVEEEVDLKEHYNFLSQYTAIAVVQGGRSNSYRFIVGTSNSQFSNFNTSFFEPGRDLENICSFTKDFYRAILNTHLLISIYPPYSKAILQHRRFVLDSAIATSKSGGVSSINKSAGIKGFFLGITGNLEKTTGDKLSRGSSLKNGASPLSSPSKLSNNAHAEELKREIQMESSMSLLHL